MIPHGFGLGEDEFGIRFTNHLPHVGDDVPITLATSHNEPEFAASRLKLPSREIKERLWSFIQMFDPYVLSDAYDATLGGWAVALEMRDGETRGHSDRVEQLMSP